jgi:hypothetical protein
MLYETKFWLQKGDNANDNTEVQMIFKDHYEQPYANKVENLEEAQKSLLRLNYDKIENIKQLIMRKEIESVLKCLTTTTTTESS